MKLLKELEPNIKRRYVFLIDRIKCDLLTDMSEGGGAEGAYAPQILIPSLLFAPSPIFGLHLNVTTHPSIFLDLPTSLNSENYDASQSAQLISQ